MLPYASNNTTCIFDFEPDKIAEQNRTEQNRTEQNRTEQNRTEQNRTEQNICHSGIHCQESLHMALHARTFRKAREQVRLMIADGFSATQIKNYLFRWGHWWVEIFASWQLQKILQEFFDSRLPGAHPSGSLAAVKIGNPADF